MNAFDSITPVVDKLKETSNFLALKQKQLKNSWELFIKNNNNSTRDYPGDETHTFKADCNIIVDTSLINEDDYGTKDITIEQYLKEYRDNNSKINDLDKVNPFVTINDCINGDYDKIKDLPVFNGMKIFFHSESYSC
jgi:hypothetical protein